LRPCAQMKEMPQRQNSLGRREPCLLTLVVNMSIVLILGERLNWLKLNLRLI
jgi:hypothetical protein